MTPRHAATPPALPVARFAERPPRKDMQNFLHLSLPGHPTALIRHLGQPDTTLVIGDMPVDWRRGQREGQLYPDLMIAFNVDARAITAERGYAIDDVGKPPDFVLEVASPRNAENDYINKRTGYANYGIPEYWRFDPTHADRYPQPLAGDRLADGAYQPITITRTDNNRYWGHSDVLNLDLCWEYGQLRWYDPVAQRYLDTHDSEANARIAERNARITAEAQRDNAEAQRDQAQAQRDAERDARIAAEERIRQLEAELRRRSQ